jgi:hypothetical protein
MQGNVSASQVYCPDSGAIRRLDEPAAVELEQADRYCMRRACNGITWDNNWWWTGTLTLYIYNAQGQLQAIETANVPSFQWNSDWTNITLT